MRIVFDLDGTLDQPALARLFVELYACHGVELTVLTGGRSREATQEVARRKLARMGLPVDVDVVVACGPGPRTVAKEKAKWLAKNRVSLFIDDSDLYCAEALRAAPSTTVLHVRAE